MRRKILIVGSNSIISKQLVKLLSSDYVIDMAYSGKTCGVQYVNAIPLNKLSSNERYHSVIILSAFIPGRNEQESQKLFEVNVALVERLVSWYKDSKIVFCSSVSVYAPATNVITEDSLPAPSNEYALSKLWAEKIIQRNAQSYVILRVSSLIGVGMKENTFLPIIIHQALSDCKIRLLGTGERLQNYIDAEELSRLIAACLEYPRNNIFLAVSDYSYSNKDIAVVVQRATNCEIEYAKDDESLSAVYDNAYTKSELKFSFTKKIELSIAEIIEWKRKQF